jgi:CheY-like chemotaxis protein
MAESSTNAESQAAEPQAAEPQEAKPQEAEPQEAEPSAETASAPSPDLDRTEPQAPPPGRDVPLILVIDDDRIFRKTLHYILERKREYRVALAEDGEVGINLALKKEPDLIICDVMMRGMHGYATIAELRTYEEMEDTPVIMLTGKGSTLGERRAQVSGADYYLYKPI